jgi:hypothetical protein
MRRASGTLQTTALLSQPGSADKVDFALKRARRAGRPVWRNLHDVTVPGSVFDVEVANLRIGVMPFAYFGCYGEGAHKHGGRARAFWAHAVVRPRRKRSADPARELLLLGSPNRPINEPWSGEDESSLMIGHGYPSEPSVLSRLVRTELQLEDASEQHHIDSVGKFEALAPGCYARFASAQTARARETMCRDEGFVTHWERRPPVALRPSGRNHRRRMRFVQGNRRREHSACRADPDPRSKLTRTPRSCRRLSARLRAGLGPGAGHPL